MHATKVDDRSKPPLEWIDGKAVPKSMPTDRHAFLQLAIAEHLKAWAKSHGGKVGPEWRFVIAPNEYKTESVVPDVAYVACYFDLPATERRYPNVPPDIAVEIVSPDDRASDVAAKRRWLKSLCYQRFSRRVVGEKAFSGGRKDVFSEARLVRR